MTTPHARIRRVSLATPEDWTKAVELLHGVVFSEYSAESADDVEARIAIALAQARADERDRCLMAIERRVIAWAAQGGCADQIEEARACANAIRERGV